MESQKDRRGVRNEVVRLDSWRLLLRSAWLIQKVKKTDSPILERSHKNG